MNTPELNKNLRVLENKLRQKSDDPDGSLDFPALINLLAKKYDLDKSTIADLYKFWDLRNQIFSSSPPKNEAADEAGAIMSSLLNNPKLQ